MKNLLLFGIIIAFYISISEMGFTQSGPEFAGPLNEVALLIEQGKWLEAAQKLEEVKEDPLLGETATYYFLKGKLHSVRYERSQALTAFEEAIDRWEEKEEAALWEVKLEKALVLSGLREIEKAEVIANECLAFFQKNNLTESLANARRYYLLGMNAARKGKLEKSAELCTKAYDIHRQNKDTNSIHMGNVAQLLAFLYWKNDQFNQAVPKFQEAEKIYRSHGGESSDWLGILYVNMGGCYDEMGYSHRAIPFYESAEAILNALDPQNSHRASIYNNLGNAYKKVGESAQSLRYHELAIRLNPQGRYYNNLGDAYLVQRDFDNAEQHFSIALDTLLNNSQAKPEEIARPYHNLAIIYREQDEFQKALDHELLSLPYRKEGGSIWLDDVARTYRGIGESYIGSQEYESAEHYLDSALLVLDSIFPSGIHREIAVTYLSKAWLFKARSKPDKVEEYLDASLAACGYEGDLEEVLSPLEFLIAIRQKAELQNDRGNIEEAYATYELGQTALNQWNRSLSESHSKAKLIQNYFALFEGAIENAADLYTSTGDHNYLEALFRTMENSKSILLREGLQRKQALQFVGVPDDLLQKEKDLKLEIANLENRDREEGEDVDRQSRLVSLKKEYAALENKFEKDYPDYYQLKFEQSLLSIKDLQEYLNRQNKKTTLVEYFMGRDMLLILSISPEDVKLHRTKIDPAFYSHIKEFRNILENDQASNLNASDWNKEFRAFTELAEELYTLTLEPVLPDQKPERIIIVPDGALGYIPFQILLSEEVGTEVMERSNYLELPYLFTQDVVFQYEYSANLLFQDKKRKSTPSIPYAGFAPIYQKTESSPEPLAANLTRKNWQPLTYNDDEILESGKILDGGKTFIAGDASEVNFREFAPKAGIIHCSMHGEVEDEEPLYSHLVFSQEEATEDQDNLLHVYELYTMELNADLAVLSACNTGAGKLQRGEGILSLSRAFKFAGCPNIIMSLWPANEFSTKEMMVGFFQHLQGGKSKAEALKNASLDYLSGKANPRAKHPFYWANLVLIGNDGSTSSTALGNWVPLVAGLGITAILLFTFFFFRRKG